jgi:hypothetical protein
MRDEEFDALMRDAARTYNRPRHDVDADALWRSIERALPPTSAERPALAVVRAEHDAPRRQTARRASAWTSAWLRTAAVLLIGVAIGRVSARPDAAPASATGATVAGAPAARAVDDADVPAADVSGTHVPGHDREAASEYLARIEVLLAALPDELRARRTDPGYASRADALLLQTRLLLDSPAAADPTLRSLFDDLEVVLAQVVRLNASRDPVGVDFLNQSLEERDVLPRLRDAVADNAAD